MTRLIDADKLVPKHFVQRTDKIIGYAGTQPIYEYVDVIAYDVDGAPTVDAEPVRHGKWIHTGRLNIYGGTELECDQCHDKVMVQHPEDERFCRHCGAKMDGERE